MTTAFHSPSPSNRSTPAGRDPAGARWRAAASERPALPTSPSGNLDYRELLWGRTSRGCVVRPNFLRGDVGVPRSSTARTCSSRSPGRSVEECGADRGGVPLRSGAVDRPRAASVRPVGRIKPISGAGEIGEPRALLFGCFVSFIAPARTAGVTTASAWTGSSRTPSTPPRLCAVVFRGSGVRGPRAGQQHQQGPTACPVSPPPSPRCGRRSRRVGHPAPSRSLRRDGVSRRHSRLGAVKK